MTKKQLLPRLENAIWYHMGQISHAIRTKDREKLVAEWNNLNSLLPEKYQLGLDLPKGKELRYYSTKKMFEFRQKLRDMGYEF